MEFQAGSRIVVLIPVGVEGKGDPVEDNGHVLRNRCDPISVMSRLTWHTTQPTLQYPIVVVLTVSNKKPSIDTSTVESQCCMYCWMYAQQLFLFHTS